jgi:ATP-dependent DNA helicase RecG
LPLTPGELERLMASPEGENLEFKEAKPSFDIDRLLKYCVALANERGGKLILGVTDRPPRKVVGSNAFTNLARTKEDLVLRLRLRIEADAITYQEKRVVVFTVPSRPMGIPMEYQGAYLMRAGQALVPMTPDRLRRIFHELGSDYSAEICRDARLEDLDPSAIARFRKLWRFKSPEQASDRISDRQLLEDAELLNQGGVTYAALVLFGTRRVLGQYLAQAEVIFEYRSGEQPGPAQQREEFREGFFLFDEKIWELVNLRNDRQSFQQGMFMRDIPTFNEGAIREAVLNAICHRDYRLAGSIFVRQFSRRIEIQSPGGFPDGINLDNILRQQAPRNRRIAEALARCGLVERSGQGMNRIFEESLKEGKPLPDFTHTDNYQVFLTIRGEVLHPEFVRFLEKIQQEKSAIFTTEDLLLLETIHRGQKAPTHLSPLLPDLEEIGVIEPVRKGQYVLSRRFYGHLGQKGVYTRKKGLDRGQNAQLLLKHIRDNAADGSRIQDMLQVLPNHSRDQVHNLLRKLKKEGLVHTVGKTKASRWYPGER